MDMLIESMYSINLFNYLIIIYRDTKSTKRHIDEDYDRRLKCTGMNNIEMKQIFFFSI
jgi:hypothetical protein